MGSSTGNPDKKSTKTVQNGKTERSWNMWEENGKATREKNNSTTWGNKPEGSGERRETKEVSTKGKTIHTKQDIPKQRKKILSTIRGAWHKNIPTTRRQRNRTILDENMAIEKAWMNKRWMNKRYEKRTRRTRGRPQSGNTYRITQKDTKKRYQTGKRLDMMEYMDSGSRNSPPFTTDEH